MACHKSLMRRITPLFLAALLGCFMNAAVAVSIAAAAADDEVRVRVGKATDLPLPRFVSLGSSLINLRRGPGRDYPIDWVYKRRGLPVEIVAEYDQWRRIRDHDGDEGWVHQSLVSGKRFVVVDVPETALMAKPDAGAPVVAVARKGVQMRLLDCQEPLWCRVEANGLKGFIPRHDLYGIYAKELYED